ncbi:MAG: hypothetical protein M3O46_05075, partial [Myxococcota bacterium]|nr:hypothetical protein [Myxococcota bacterium]
MENRHGNVTDHHRQCERAKADLGALYRALIHGINTQLAGVDSFVLGKQTFSRADLLARLQSRIDAAEAVKANRATLQKSVADERTADSSMKPLRAQMKSYLQARFGKVSPELQDFGFTPTRKAKPSAVVKAAAVSRAKATRVARGTKGTQQKKLIKAPPVTAVAPPGPTIPATSAPVNAASSPTTATVPG